MKAKLVAVAVLMIALLSLTVGKAYANGFGEVATGPCKCLPFSVMPGQTENLTWTLVNSYQYPLSFYIQPAVFKAANGTVPNVTYQPINGTIPANSTIGITIQVKLPRNASVNSSWSAYATAFASSAPGSGTKIAIGTAKLLEITSLPTTTTTIPPSVYTSTIVSAVNSYVSIPQIDIVVGAVVVIILIVVICLLSYAFIRKKSRSR